MTLRSALLTLLYSCHFSATAVLAQQTGGLPVNIITTEPGIAGSFAIAGNSGAACLRYDPTDFKGVIRAISDLQTDIKKVTGQQPQLSTSAAGTGPEIIIGTLGKSKWIDELVKSKKADVKELAGQWESFIITTLNNESSGQPETLVVAGSDKRGTIYGIYELCRQLGVSPWYWWADVPVKKKPAVFVLPGRYLSGSPKVKYRGIFINDEAPCFTGWTKEKFGGVNSKMYTHLFELLLRLRANYLWPAMWGNAFNEDDTLNPRLADEYGIVMGTSHHEPMLRAQKEWGIHRSEYGNGEWNYTTNEQGLKSFWLDGLTRNKNYESILTMGMRGDGDLPLKDQGNAEENFRTLERIMKDQRNIIEKVTGKPASKIPQLWALYSEVLEYYDQGIKVPDDMTILLCDDNWGDVRRLPEPGAKKHPGGYGIYYHVDLHGAPRAYQWLNMTQIPHIWEQLQLTYSYGVDKIWILNVGDIKPNEYPMDFFLQMAWAPAAFNENNLQVYAEKFCDEQFGAAEAKEAADIISTYCKYNSRITAEMLDSKTYNLQSGEFLQVKNGYLALETRALRQFNTLSDEYKDAYTQLVLHPVRAMANLYDMYYAVAMNTKLAAERDYKANYWADYAEACYKRDSLYSYDYNHNVSGGKWNHIMDQTHIGYKSWDEPKGGNIKPTVFRINPGETAKGGYLFTEKNKVVVMEAEHYYTSTSAENTRWAVIPDLGRTLSGMALLPYTENPAGGTIQFRFNLRNQPDSIKVRMYFDCTLPFKKNGHQVAVSVDGGPETTRNINSELTWKNNYSKMYPAGAARMIEVIVTIALPKTAEQTFHTLSLRALDPGVVYYKLIIDNGGYEPSFLKMNESPYIREFK